MFGTILVPLDGTPFSERAIPHAARLAAASQARLVLLQSVASPETKKPGEGEQAVRNELARHAHSLRQLGLTVDHAVYHDLPSEAILRAIRWYEPGLILMCTHARGEVERWYQGSCADDVVRFGNVPALLIPPNCPSPWGDRLDEVLVPLDGSDLAAQAIDPAAALAQALGARLTLFFVVPPAIQERLTGRHFAENDPAVRAQAGRRLLDEQLAHLHAKGIAAGAETAIGHPHIAIAERGGKEGVAAIAIATHGLGGLQRTAMGSTATATLLRATVPLLLVRPERTASAPAPHCAGANGEDRMVELTALERSTIQLALYELVDRIEPASSTAKTAQAVLSKLGGTRRVAPV